MVDCLDTYRRIGKVIEVGVNLVRVLRNYLAFVGAELAGRGPSTISITLWASFQMAGVSDHE